MFIDLQTCQLVAIADSGNYDEGIDGNE